MGVKLRVIPLSQVPSSTDHWLRLHLSVATLSVGWYLYLLSTISSFAPPQLLTAFKEPIFSAVLERLIFLRTEHGWLLLYLLWKELHEKRTFGKTYPKPYVPN
jgi:succinate dehydrogenase hydrophobic anchor subunit